MILIYLIIAVALVYFVTVTADYLKTKKIRINCLKTKGSV